MFSLLIVLKLLIITIFLNSSMIASDNDVLEVAVVESSFNVFYKLVLAADKNLVFVFWTWLVIFFRLAFLVSYVDIFDVTLFMFQHL